MDLSRFLNVDGVLQPPDYGRSHPTVPHPVLSWANLPDGIIQCEACGTFLDRTRWAASPCPAQEGGRVTRTLDETLARYHDCRRALEAFVAMMTSDFDALSEIDRQDCLRSLNHACDLLSIWRTRAAVQPRPPEGHS